MAMNKEELIKYKETLEAELKTDELALKRIKTKVDYQRKYLKLCEEQIKSLAVENSAHDYTEGANHQ